MTVVSGLVVGDGGDIVVPVPSGMRDRNLAVFWLAATDHSGWPVRLGLPIYYRLINNLLGLLNENSNASARVAFHQWDGRTEYVWTAPPAGSRLHYAFWPGEVGFNDRYDLEQYEEGLPFTPLVWTGGEITAQPPTSGSYRAFMARYWATADGEPDGFTSGLTVEDVTSSVVDLGGGDVTTATYTLDNPGTEPSTYLDGWATDAWLAFIGGIPPLRQNQRDDIRQGQRTSRQLTVRQAGYL